MKLTDHSEVVVFLRLLVLKDLSELRMMDTLRKCSILLLMGYLLNVQSFQIKTSIVHRYSRNCKVNLRRSSLPASSGGEGDKGPQAISGLENAIGGNVDKSGGQKSYETYGESIFISLRL